MEKHIAHFVSQLSQYIPVYNYVCKDGIWEIRLEEKTVLIYPPGTNRLESATNAFIHIDYDVIISMPTKIINRIKGLLGVGERIYARKTVVARVDKAVTQSFLDEYHFNGVMPGKYRYGLFYKGDLVSIAVFSGGRKMPELGENHRSFELIRFCHKADVLVVGGLSKMLKAFISDFNPQDIMTYVDKDWASQSSLETLGFKVIGSLPGIKFGITKEGERIYPVHQKEDIAYWVENSGSLKLKLIL